MNKRPIVLGHPFFSTTHVNVDCQTGRKTLEQNRHPVEENLFNNNDMGHN